MNDCACGCKFTPDETILCPTATMLWNNVQNTYEAANRRTGTWDEYSQAQQAYYDHYTDQEALAEMEGQNVT